MSEQLAAALVGLALLDAVNTSTLFMVMVVVLTARRPAQTGLAYAIAAVLTFLGLAVGLYLGASAAASLIADVGRWLRRATFALLTVWFGWLAFRRLRDRPRKPLLLPAWFGPLAALPLGAAATVADLPNAFPLFIAVERLVAAQVTWEVAVLALAGYVTVYALPIGLVLWLGVTRGPRVRAAMKRITDRFLSGVAHRSLRWAAVLATLALASATVVAVV